MKAPLHPYHFKTPAEWRAWLQDHHAIEKEAWLVIRRAGSGHPGIYLDEAVEEALCFGWIDSVMKGVDEDRYYLRFTPRKPNSIWSVSNQLRVEKLIAEGRMAEAGMIKVRQARENGQWDAAQRREDVSTLPQDLAGALADNPQAQILFEALPASKKKQYIHWIDSARREETRHKRVQQTIRMVLSGN